MTTATMTKTAKKRVRKKDRLLSPSAMDVISCATARQRLAATMDKVIDGHEPVIINSQKAGSVIMMSLDDFNGFRETMYLLESSANAEHLRKAIADLDAGKGIEVSLDDL